jgi:hypothetical protein
LQIDDVSSFTSNNRHLNNMLKQITLAALAATLTALIVSNLPVQAGTVTYLYDDLRRLEQIIYDKDHTIIYAYDEAGNRITQEVSGLCKGDLNNDGEVGNDDYILLRAEWGRRDCTPANPCTGDLNEDGIVNVIDFSLLVREWGQTGCPVQ